MSSTMAPTCVIHFGTFRCRSLLVSAGNLEVSDYGKSTAFPGSSRERVRGRTLGTWLPKNSISFSSPEAPILLVST